jgi:hypothetical protein
MALNAFLCFILPTTSVGMISHTEKLSTTCVRHLRISSSIACSVGMSSLSLCEHFQMLIIVLNLTIR